MIHFSVEFLYSARSKEAIVFTMLCFYFLHTTFSVDEKVDQNVCVASQWIRN